jgi:hypothetical protein
VCTGDLSLSAIEAWPGGGLALVSAAPLEGATLPGFTLATAAVPDGPGLTAIVLAPGRVDEARSRIASLPADERIALAAGDQLLADLTRDRAHLEARLVDPPAPSSAAFIADLAAQLALVDAPRRSLYTAAPPVATGFRPVAFNARPALTRVGACGPPLPVDSPLTLSTATGSCTFGAPPPLTERSGEACDPAAIAADAYSYPDTLAITLTDDQRVLWAQDDAARSESDFNLSISLGGAPIAARAHFHGSSSLACARKSLSIDLDGPDRRRLGPGFASDEFLLISLCLDDGYFRQAFAERLYAASGVFPLHRRFVRLTVDGVPHGVYWLLEKPADALVADGLATRSVVRRRFDPDDFAPDVDYPDDGAGIDQARRDYARLDDIAAGSPADMVADLAAAFDLDGYLRWLALDSLLLNGDSTDEMFFAGAAEAGATWFHLTAWDPDDLGSACHHEGVHAITDPCSLTYCAEANLDHGLLASTELYERYSAVLRQTLDTWTEQRLADELDGVRDALFAALTDDATAAAMTELGARTAADARTAIQTRIDAYRAQLATRRLDLQAHLGTCHE